MLGHMPMLADTSFAQFSQEIGLASLGASDEDIVKLSSCYLYTVEFGLCLENESVRAFGAGLLSSKGELEHAVAAVDKIQNFDPVKAGEQEFFVTSFQPTYFLSPSLEYAKVEMRKFIGTIKKEVSLKYEPATSTIHVV